jgi:predicted short-subunit dehydrogenase-like oxidoreductase (DUF2520 family)
LDARLRLRSVLRRVVEDIRLLIVPRGHDRLAAVQIWFAGSGHRDYLIFNRPARAKGKKTKVLTEGFSQVKSLADVTALGPLDLRKRADAKKLAAAVPMAALLSLMADDADE